jgi:imidazolonepropionase-like amidohydrolase
MDHLIGSVETGKQADLLLVPGDPVADIGAMRRPALVMKAGRVYADRLAVAV